VFRDGISVTIGSDGLPLISYQSFGLKVAHCSNAACSAATTATLQSGDLGDWSSLSTGSDGFGLVSYFNRETDSLMVAHCSNINCSSATISTIDSGGIGGFTSLAIGTDGLSVISYETPQRTWARSRSRTAQIPRAPPRRSRRSIRPGTCSGPG
jgi:hypothetical protein